jgi:hypothetical protein
MISELFRQCAIFFKFNLIYFLIFLIIFFAFHLTPFYLYYKNLVDRRVLRFCHIVSLFLVQNTIKGNVPITFFL